RGSAPGVSWASATANVATCRPRPSLRRVAMAGPKIVPESGCGHLQSALETGALVEPVGLAKLRAKLGGGRAADGAKAVDPVQFDGIAELESQLLCAGLRLQATPPQRNRAEHKAVAAGAWLSRLEEDAIGSDALFCHARVGAGSPDPGVLRFPRQQQLAGRLADGPILTRSCRCDPRPKGWKAR